MQPVVWSQAFEEDGVVSYRTGRQGSRLVAEWPHLARLTCGRKGTSPRLKALNGASPRSLSKLRGVVKALLGDLRGGLGVHASAVAIGDSAVVLVGESGAGKSSTAAELCRDHGASLLADDAAVLEQRGDVVHVLPSEATHYLYEDASEALRLRARATRKHGDKLAIRPRRVAARAYPLTLVTCLRFDDSLMRSRARRLTGAEAAVSVLGSMFRFDVTDRRRDLDRVMRVYEQAPFIEIARPHARPSAAHHVLNALEQTHA